MKKGKSAYPNILTRTNIFTTKRFLNDNLITSSHKYNDIFFKYEGKELNITTDFMLIGLISKLYQSNNCKTDKNPKIILTKKIICDYFNIAMTNYKSKQASTIFSSIQRLDSSRIIIDNAKKYAQYSLITAFEYDKSNKEFTIYLNKFSEIKNAGTFIDLLDLRFTNKNNYSSYLDVTYIDLDEIIKLKPNPTAVSIFAELSTHNLKKGFSFEKMKGKAFCSDQMKNKDIKKKIITALNFIKNYGLILDFHISDDYNDKEWLKIIPNNSLCEIDHAEMISQYFEENIKKKKFSFDDIKSAIEEDFNFNDLEVKSFIAKALKYLKSNKTITDYLTHIDILNDTWLIIEGYESKNNKVVKEKTVKNNLVKKTPRKTKVVKTKETKEIKKLKNIVSNLDLQDLI